MSAPRNPPIRELLLRWRDRHSSVAHVEYGGGWCETCGSKHPCDDFVDAVAALDALEACDEMFFASLGPATRHLLVPDPSPRGDDPPKENT